MYRAIVPDGEMTAAQAERDEAGVTLYTDDGEMKAFVPYPHLLALVNEDALDKHERQFEHLLL